MEALLHDLTRALIAARRRPWFTGVAALSLAIGIGATSAVFSVANSLLLRPLPGVPGYERAVEIGRTDAGRGFDTFSYPEFLDLASEVPALDAVAAYSLATFSLGTEEGARQVAGQLVSESYLAALQVVPGAGRSFSGAESEPGANVAVAIISHRLWQDRFGGEAGVVGSAVLINRRPFTVVGVTPRGFGGHVAGVTMDVYLPLGARDLVIGPSEDLFTNRRASWLLMVGRLSPGNTVERANAQAGALFERLADATPEVQTGRSARVIALGPVPGGGRAAVRGFIGAMLALSGLVLLVTCTNVAGMFLARGVQREREIAVRLALGAGRRRLVQQLVGEALFVFVIGGVLGVVLAQTLTGAIDLASLPTPVALELDLSLDWTVMGFALVVTLVTGLLFGALPAARSSRPEVVRALREESRSGTGRGGWLRRTFVSAQVGASVVLVIVAGLFLRSLQEAGSVAVGFDPAQAYVTTLDLSQEGIENDTQGMVLVDAILERVRAEPGLELAAVALDLPLDLSSHGTGATPEGWDAAEAGPLGVDFNFVSPQYFDVLSVSVLEGRIFTPGDREGTLPVAVVSREFARRAWPGESAVGRHVQFGRNGPSLEIVGVVEDVKNQLITEPAKPFIYRPAAQAFDPRVSVVVRSNLDEATVGRSLRSALLAVDPGFAVTAVHSVDRLTSVGTLPQRLGATIASALGSVALLLAGVGLYALIAFMVVQRTREIGVRMALGARRSGVVWLVVYGTLRIAVPGALLGAAVAAGVGHLLRSMVLGVGALDPATFLSTGALLCSVVALASLVPAVRAASVRPVDALRSE